MIRTPLRPLARILTARQKGENPDAIERENRRIRFEQTQAASRKRAERRLWVMSGLFVMAFCVLALRMGHWSTIRSEPARASTSTAQTQYDRADILDRNGHILATNMPTFAVYAHPHQLLDPARAARELARIFPDRDEAQLLEQLSDPARKFVWIKRVISPEQRRAVHDLGEPGVHFGPRETRIYPNGALAAHVLGGVKFGHEGVNFAELIGIAGIEHSHEAVLRDPARRDTPLRLSIDLSVQAAIEEVLGTGMKYLHARGAAAVLMDIETGEIVSLVSLPDFDPNDRPRPPLEGEASDSPLFNRAVQGVYELGSTFKIFTAAQAMSLGIVHANTKVDTSPPLEINGARIGEFEGHNYGNLTVEQIIVKSSNRGVGRLALSIGSARQQEFMRDLGFFEQVPVELSEAVGGKPLLPERWGDLSTVTVSYGHGISVTPLHLAVGYAAIANGGQRITPTLLRQDAPQVGPHVLPGEAAQAARDMLRKVVTEGTASFADVAGYPVAGKTGTADKPRPGGGYFEDKTITTFASFFPANAPRYVLVVTLDEPVEASGETPRRTAGWTAVPVASEMIGQIAPLLGLRPHYQLGQVERVMRSAH